MSVLYFVIIASIFAIVKSEVNTEDTSPIPLQTPYAVYKSQNLQPVPYVTHRSPYYQPFDETSNHPHYSAVAPVALVNEGPFHMVLNGMYNLGVYILQAVALFIVGGIFISTFCSVTSLCTITFNGTSTINKDTMRAFMTPEKLATAAAIVQDAVGKYQRLQKSANN